MPYVRSELQVPLCALPPQVARIRGASYRREGGKFLPRASEARQRESASLTPPPTRVPSMMTLNRLLVGIAPWSSFRCVSGRSSERWAVQVREEGE